MPKTEADKLYRQMFDAWNAGEIAFALEVSRRLLQEFPSYHIGWLLQGILLYELARYDDAENSLRHALKLIPDKSLYHGYVHLGHLYKSRGEYKDAERYYQKAIKLAPQKAGSHIYLGAALAKKGDLKGAEKAHLCGTRCSEGPTDEAFLNLGYVLRAQERYSEALECFTKALELTSDYEEASIAKEDMAKVLAYIGTGK